MTVSGNDVLVEIPLWYGVRAGNGAHPLEERVLVCSSSLDLLGQGKRNVQLRTVYFAYLSGVTGLLVPEIC